MVPPPSTVQNDAPVSTTAVSLVDTVHKLYDLIFKNPLPKTRTMKTAKTVAISVEVWHMAHELATSARAALHRQHNAPRLDAISRQLEVITARLGAPNAPPITQKLPYASALTEGTQCLTQVGTMNLHPPLCPCPRPAKRFDITLVQKSRDSPVFTKLSNEELISEILNALRDGDCWYEDRACTPDSEGNEVIGRFGPCIKAVG